MRVNHAYHANKTRGIDRALSVSGGINNAALPLTKFYIILCVYTHGAYRHTVYHWVRCLPYTFFKQRQIVASHTPVYRGRPSFLLPNRCILAHSEADWGRKSQNAFLRFITPYIFECMKNKKVKFIANASITCIYNPWTCKSTLNYQNGKWSQN